MATAYHEGGPADGQRVKGVEQTPFRFWADVSDRASRTWVTLHRYVFAPPRDGAKCCYRYTGTHQVLGPVPGPESFPEWTT